ncbi:hypothetical protein [Geodermatophilus sp. URMC 64]
MTTTDLDQLLVTGHAADLRRRAAGARLAALARCCRPGAWARTGHRVQRWAERLATRTSRDAACCARA